MLSKHELQNLLSGTGTTTEKDLIQTISHHLRESKAAGAGIEEKERIKEQEAAVIIAFAEEHLLFCKGVDPSKIFSN